MTFEDWAIEYFGGIGLAPDACRDAWKAAAKAEREKVLEMCKCHEYASDLADTIRAMED